MKRHGKSTVHSRVMRVSTHLGLMDTETNMDGEMCKTKQRQCLRNKNVCKVLGLCKINRTKNRPTFHVH